MPKSKLENININSISGNTWEKNIRERRKTTTLQQLKINQKHPHKWLIPDQISLSPPSNDVSQEKCVNY